MKEAYFGHGIGTIFFSRVGCDVGLDYKIINCPATYYPSNCEHAKDAGVRCNREALVHSVNVNTVNNSPNAINLSAFITWERSSRTNEDVTSYNVECHNNDHSIAVTVSKQTQNVSLAGLLPSTTYSCCVSAIYHDAHIAKGTCDTSDTGLFTTEIEASGSSSSTSVIGGVLSFIIVLLLVLLIISVIALVCVLRPGARLKNSALYGRYVYNKL